MFELTAEQKRAWRWACRFKDLRCKESDLALALETQLAGKLSAEHSYFLHERGNLHGRCPDCLKADWLAEARRALGEE